MDTQHRIIIVDVLATTLEPLHQGGDSTGTTLAELRREEFIVDGRIERIPVISANSIGHALREATAYWFMDRAGIRRFEASQMRAVNLLFSGGGKVRKVNSPGYISVAEDRELRALFPPLSIFGGSFGNRMLKGRLRVGSGIPVCRETVESLPDWLKPSASLSVYDLIQELNFSTFDPRENADYEHFLDAKIFEQYRAEQEERRKKNKAGAEMKLRRSVECLKAGTKLWFELRLQYPTTIDLGTFLGGLGYFYERPFLGGKRNRGFGRIKVEFRGFEVKGLSRVERDLADTEAIDQAAAHLSANADKIREVIDEL